MKPNTCTGSRRGSEGRGSCQSWQRHVRAGTRTREPARNAANAATVRARARVMAVRGRRAVSRRPAVAARADRDGLERNDWFGFDHMVCLEPYWNIHEGV